MLHSTKKLVGACALVAFAGVGSALAQTSPQTAALAVTAAVANNCIVSTIPVAFGNYNPLAAITVTATGGVNLRCTRGTLPTIALNLGSNATGATRRMASGAERLAYELYRPVSNAASAACPAAGTGSVWGTGAAALVVTASPGSATTRTYNVCGVLTPGQDVAAGGYADSVTATVTF